MEASLIVRVECRDTAHRDFVRLMLGAEVERPLFEDEVAESERAWFKALEDVLTAEVAEPRGDKALEAAWTLGGTDWDEDLRDILQCLKRADVLDAYAVVAGDEGWYELWVLQNHKVARHSRWKGRDLADLFDGQEDLGLVLDRIRLEAMTS